MRGKRVRPDLFGTNADQKRNKDISAREVLIFAGSILALAGSIAKDYASLPAWYVFLVATLIALAILSLTPKFLSPAVQYARARRTEARQDSIAKKVFPELVEHIKNYGALFEHHRLDNVPTVLTYISQGQDFKSKFGVPSVTHFYERYLLLSDRLARFNGTKDDLQLLAKEFDTLLMHYVKDCVVAPLQKLVEIGVEKIPQHLRGELNLQRETLATYLRSYMVFGDKVNKQVGSSLFRTDFEIPRGV